MANVNFVQVHTRNIQNVNFVQVHTRNIQNVNFVQDHTKEHHNQISLEIPMYVSKNWVRC